MRVTIIADASYCSQTGAAGYGFWIACERGKRGGGGPIERKLDNSSSAEMMAIVNAVYIAATRELIQQGDHVLLQTDCQSAIDAFSNLRKRLKQTEKDAKDEFYKLKREHGFTFSFRHVKGHTSRPEARYVTNNLCDKRAREGLRLARQRLADSEE